MKKQTIAFFEIKDSESSYIKKKLKSFNLLFFDDIINNVNISKFKNVDMISTFIYSRVSKDTMTKLPNLKVIASRSTGFDHIDLVAAKKKNISVLNVPFYGENTVAEHTFALILSLSRHVHKSYVRTLKDDFSIDGLTGFDLKGKTMGLIGGGRIGMHVAKIARGFGMKVLVFDLRHDTFLQEVIGFEYVEMDYLLKNSDVISLHVPYNKHTNHLINKESLSKMKKSAVLINTARGGLIDTDALYHALSKKQLAGAGLDVIEGEEYLKEEHALLHNSSNPDKWRSIVRDNKIFKLDNVVFTPHNAFNSKEALLRILDTSLDNLLSCQDGTCQNLVN